MYLTHLIVIILIVRHAIFYITPNIPSLAIFIYTLIVVLPLTIIVSSASYYVVEKPFLNLRVQYLKPKNSENVKENNIARVP
jgi:peptidoglycan/LPS O-acetylase OafA/YrhL